MARGIQVVLGLGVTGLLLFLVAGPLGKLQVGLVGDRAVSRPATPPAVAPTAMGADEDGRQALSAIGFQPEEQRTLTGEALPVTIRRGTGQPLRVPPQIANLVRRQNLELVIAKYAQQYGVDQDLVWAVIRQESGFNPQAVSPKGAMGLMQLMPGTAAMLGVSDAFDVEQNIAGGIKYLERCLNQFNQDVSLALAAYNAGPNNVVKYQGCPPFPETRQYVASILQAYAGEPMTEALKLLGISPVMGDDSLDSAGLIGLAWRVPRAQWRIATPQCKLGSPRWKVSLLPF